MFFFLQCKLLQKCVISHCEKGSIEHQVKKLKKQQQRTLPPSSGHTRVMLGKLPLPQESTDNVVHWEVNELNSTLFLSSLPWGLQPRNKQTAI